MISEYTEKNINSIINFLKSNDLYDYIKVIQTRLRECIDRKSSMGRDLIKTFNTATGKKETTQKERQKKCNKLLTDLEDYLKIKIKDNKLTVKDKLNNIDIKTLFRDFFGRDDDMVRYMKESIEEYKAKKENAFREEDKNKYDQHWMVDATLAASSIIRILKYIDPPPEVIVPPSQGGKRRTKRRTRRRNKKTTKRKANKKTKMKKRKTHKRKTNKRRRR